MIELGNPQRALAHHLMEIPGGFAWWYADLVNEHGDGIVLIWSFGLPFLPGIAAADRKGNPLQTKTRPSVNVCVYRRWKPEFYLLQEYETNEAQWEPGTEDVRIGDCHFSSKVVDGKRRLDVTLNCPLPGTTDRLTGTISGQALSTGIASPDSHDAGHHEWTPLFGPGHLHAELSVGKEHHFSISGRGYHDRNGGNKALHNLGIKHWFWGRGPDGDTDKIYYLLWPEGGGAPRAWGLEIDNTGEVTRVPLTITRHGSWFTRYGRWLWKSLTLEKDGQPWLKVKRRSIVDNGPFYVRMLTEHIAPRGDVSFGTAEAVYPHMVDRGPIQFFVQMCTHHVSKPSPAIVAWFNGLSTGRLERFQLAQQSSTLLTARQDLS